MQMARYTTVKQFKDENPSKTFSQVKESAFADFYGSMGLEDDGDGQVLHPALIRMVNGEAPKDIQIAHDWTDDHVFCCLLLIEFADETYTVGFWWMDPSFLLSIGRTINNPERAVDFVKGMFDNENVWKPHLKQ